MYVYPNVILIQSNAQKNIILAQNEAHSLSSQSMILVLM